MKPKNNISILLFVALLSVVGLQTLFAQTTAQGWLKKAEKESGEAMVEYASKAIELDNKLPQAYYLRAIGYSNINKKGMAEIDFDYALFLDPEFAEAHIEQAMLKFHSNKFRDAIILYTKALMAKKRYYPKEYNPYKLNNVAFYFRGRCNLGLQLYEKAISDFNSALNIYPKDKEALVYRTKAKVFLGDFKSALLDYDKIIDLDSKNPDLYSERAKIFQELHLYSKALEDIGVAIKITDEAIFYLERGDIYYKMGNYNSASDSYLSAKVKAPSWYLAQHHYLTAVKAKLSPDNPAPLYPKTEKRLALIIGNSSYTNFRSLDQNPLNDAEDMARKLQNMGIEVMLYKDLDMAHFEEALQAFQAKAIEIKADVMLFFFAGHGMELGGVNYLIPTDATLDSYTQSAVTINHVLATMQAAKPLFRVVFLDACRNNPFPTNTTDATIANLSTDKARGEVRGVTSSNTFSKIELPMAKDMHTLIAFATNAGNTAQNSDGFSRRNGAFTAALLKHLRRGVDVGVILREVRKTVEKNNGQAPEQYDAMSESFEF
jgi:tetratricopeptide (TPR) repeat protein